MTLHDRLKEIIDQHNYNLCMNPGSPDQDTITAIIAAFTERLPGEQWVTIDNIVESIRAKGWNAYRQEVLKVLAGELGK